MEFNKEVKKRVQNYIFLKINNRLDEKCNTIVSILMAALMAW